MKYLQAVEIMPPWTYSGTNLCPHLRVSSSFSCGGSREGGHRGRKRGRGGHQHCPGHTDQWTTRVSRTTCFSWWGPPLAPFLRELGLVLPQRVGVLAQPGCGAAPASAAESGFSTGEEKGKEGCQLQPQMCPKRGHQGGVRGRNV